MRLVFEITGMPRLAENLRGAAEDAQDYRDAWPGVAERVRLMGTNQIASAGVRGGKPYQPLKRSTLRYKEIHFPGKAVLRRTDVTFQAVADPSVEAEPDSVAFTVPLKRAALHQEGTRGMPARAIYEPTPEDEREVVEIVRRAKARQLERRGFA